MQHLKQQKDLIRKRFIKLRLSLLRDKIAIDSSMIALKLQNMNIFQNAKNFLLYMPVKNEVDTKYILSLLVESKKNIFLPAFDKSGWIISKLKMNDDLVSGPFNIKQPKKISRSSIDDCDIAIVPGIAFSQSGVRVGYGKGVYDKLLENSRCIKIGLCYDFGLIKSLESQINDVPMDIVISEKRMIKLI